MLAVYIRTIWLCDLIYMIDVCQVWVFLEVCAYVNFYVFFTLLLCLCVENDLSFFFKKKGDGFYCYLIFFDVFINKITFIKKIII